MGILGGKRSGLGMALIAPSLYVLEYALYPIWLGLACRIFYDRIRLLVRINQHQHASMISHF